MKKTLKIALSAGSLLLIGSCYGALHNTPPQQQPQPDPPSTPTPTPVVPGDPDTVRDIRLMLNSIDVEPEGSPSPYDRDEFEHWIDLNGCDTRAEVLEQASDVPVDKTESCTVKTGRWVSPYTGETFTQASDLQIDHLVPLKEAWDSGAHQWSEQDRQKFANDMNNPQLVAVDSFSNQQKVDSDPTEWMPTENECGYIQNWIIVKSNWGLSMDPAEWNSVDQQLTSCTADN